MYRGLPSSAPSNLPVAANAAKRVLCLPIYPDLEISAVDQIINIMKG
jgi:dTDP-4-amino-4,6-dideoxygalactose transaminase